MMRAITIFFFLSISASAVNAPVIPADLTSAFFEVRSRISARQAQISDLQRQLAVLQIQAMTARQAMARFCQAKDYNLVDVQIPDGTEGETHPSCQKTQKQN